MRATGSASAPLGRSCLSKDRPSIFATLVPKAVFKPKCQQQLWRHGQLRLREHHQEGLLYVPAPNTEALRTSGAAVKWLQPWIKGFLSCDDPQACFLAAGCLMMRFLARLLVSTKVIWQHR